MPAIPAWPPESSVRLYVDTPLTEGAAVIVDGAQAHYLSNVMRLSSGARLKLFDDVSGEWLAEITDISKRRMSLVLVAHLRPREPVPDLWLGAALIRRTRFELIAEKACELGAARLTPLITRRTVVDRAKHERLRAHMVEAAEQCGRTALPALDSEMPLGTWLTLLGQRTLFFADETGGRPAAAAFAEHEGGAAILIGPEGGFDDAERATIRATPGAVAVSLGPRILRAETAAIAAIATWMAVAGDWTTHERGLALLPLEGPRSQR